MQVGESNITDLKKTGKPLTLTLHKPGEVWSGHLRVVYHSPKIMMTKYFRHCPLLEKGD